MGKAYHDFNPRAPCGARPGVTVDNKVIVQISTHAPLAGRDYVYKHKKSTMTIISTHAPLAGRDARPPVHRRREVISTHAPLAGRDGLAEDRVGHGESISTHAPLAGRDRAVTPKKGKPQQFQPTRPLRGATHILSNSKSATRFQPTRPLRGATSEIDEWEVRS